jgi:hypothetical protein
LKEIDPTITAYALKDCDINTEVAFGGEITSDVMISIKENRDFGIVVNFATLKKIIRARNPRHHQTEFFGFTSSN